MLSSFVLPNVLFAVQGDFAQQGEFKAWDMIILVAVLAVLFGLVIFAIVALSYARWWIQSLFSRAGIGLFDLIGMSFKKVKLSLIHI